MIGGDVLVVDMKKRHSHCPGTTMLYLQENEGQTEHSKFGFSDQKKSFFQILNVLIKSSIATDPFLVAEIFNCGFAWCILIVVIFYIFTQLSFYLYIQSWIYGQAYSYNAIWRELFGKQSCSWLVLLFVIINYLSFTIWNQHEIHFHFSNIILNLWPNSPSILTNVWLSTYLLPAIFVVPHLLVKKLTNLDYMSIFSNFCLIVGLVCLIVYYFRFTNNNDIEFSVTVEESDLKPFKNDIFYIFNAIGVISSALFYNPILSVAVQDLYMPSINRTMSLTWITSTFSVIIHLLGGFFSYLINPDNEGDVIFYDVSAYNDDRSKIVYPEVIIGQIATFCISICSNIFYTYFVSKQLAEMIFPYSVNSSVSTFFCGVTVVLFSSAMNFIEEVATDVADLIAGVVSMILAYILPPVYYFFQYKFSHKLFGVLSVFLLFFGIVVSIATLVCGILDF